MELDHDTLAQSVRTGGRFSTVPARAYADVRLKPGDIHVLGILAITDSSSAIERREGWFTIAQGTVAMLGGVSRSKVNKAVATLLATGYLEYRKQKTGRGGNDAGAYKIVHDGDLDARYDRWQGAEAPGTSDVVKSDRGCSPADTPVSKSDKGPETHGFSDVVKSDRGCSPADTPVSKSDKGREQQGKPDVPGDDSTDCLLSSSPSLESNSFLKNEEVDSTVQTAAERIVELFLGLRRTHYPGCTSKPSARTKLVADAAGYITAGLSERVFEAVLNERFTATSKVAGMEAPAGITRFRKELDKAVRELADTGHAPIRLPDRQTAGPRPAVRPQRSGPETDPALAGLVERLRADIPPLAPWLGMCAFHSDNDGSDGPVLHVVAATDTACNQVRGHADTIASIYADFAAVTSPAVIVRRR